MIRFSLRGEFIELFKLLKVTGLCATGGEAKTAVAAGLVKVNGQTEMRKGCKLKPGQKVELGGQEIEIQSMVDGP